MAQLVPATLDITAAREEVRLGDRLLPARRQAHPAYIPHPPTEAVQGQVVKVHGDAVHFAGQYQVVVLNRGREHGLEPGHVLALLKDGGHVTDSTDPAKPRLALPGGEPVAFTALGAGSGEARATLGESGRLAILAPDGREVAGWIVEVVPDATPTVSFLDEPKVTHRGVLRIAFEAADDYGVAEIGLELSLVGRAAEAERLPLAKTQPRPGKFASAAYSDLLAHPFAGLPVRMRLEASDSLGQTGRSGPLEITLPERQFRNPGLKPIRGVHGTPPWACRTGPPDCFFIRPALLSIAVQHAHALLRELPVWLISSRTSTSPSRMT